MVDFDRRMLMQGAMLASALSIAATRASAETEAPLVVIAELVAKAGQEKALRDLLVPFAEQSRKEPGCMRYELLEVQSEPGRFLTVETWASKASLDAHMSTPAIKAAVPLLGPILAKPFTQTMLNSLSV
jgi:quinol monooxygenase YgiN